MPPLRHNENKLPVHSLDADSRHINILPLDHTNPYDFKREHRHTYYEMMFIDQGGGNQLIDFGDYPVHDHSCYIILPQQVHLMNRKQSSGKLIQFTAERIASAELRAALNRHAFQEQAAILFEHRPELIRDFEVLLALLGQTAHRTDPGSRIAATSLLESIVSLALLHRTHTEPSAADEDKRLILAFYEHLEEHYTRNIGVQQYVSLLGTTEKKLTAAARKYAGFTPLQVIHNRVLLEAKRLLLFANIPHKEIAYQLGFDSPASFSAFIKSKTGSTPSELSAHLAEIHK